MTTPKPTRLIWASLTVIVIALGAALAFFAVDFAAGAALIGGIVLALGLRWLIAARRRESPQPAAPPEPAPGGLVGAPPSPPEQAEEAEEGTVTRAARRAPAAPPPVAAPQPAPARARQKGGPSRAVRIIAGVLALAVCAAVVIGLVSLISFGLPGSGGEVENPPEEVGQITICPSAIVTGLQLVVEPTDLKRGRVTVGGTLTAYAPGPDDGPWDECEREANGEPFPIGLESVEVSARKLGTLVWEVAFSTREQARGSLDAAGYGDARLRYEEIEVELRDFPRNVFLDARAARDLAVSPYLKTQTVTWWQRASDPVRFSYIPPAWRFARPLLNLSYTAGSVGEGVVVLGGALGTFAVSSVFQAVIGDYGKEQISKWTGRLGKKRRR